MPVFVYGWNIVHLAATSSTKLYKYIWCAYFPVIKRGPHPLATLDLA